MHVLALQALLHHSGPGTFRIAGHRAPSLLGQVLHWIAEFFKIITIVVTLLLLLARGFRGTRGTVLIEMLFVLLIGMVALPGLSPKFAHYTNDITHGSAVGSTGASAGMVALMSVIVALTIYFTMIKRAPALEEE